MFSEIVDLLERRYEIEKRKSRIQPVGEDHPVIVSHLAKYRSLMPSLALIIHLIDGVDRGAAKTRNREHPGPRIK